MVWILSLMLSMIASAATAQEKTREQKVREDRERVEAQGSWIYNDLPRAMAQAKRTGQPLLVALRCIPCEECVKLDDEIVENDSLIGPLLQKFVCARVVSTNGLDLATFQYDTDQSFAVFMLNADGAIYGRFGTRSHRTEWLGDVSLKGLGQAMQGALELHAQYPHNQASLGGKRGPKPPFKTPEEFPTLQGKYASTLNYDGDVVKSCIHCHQIGDAQRDLFRSRRQPIPETVLFPHPHPKSLGMILDADQRATIKRVEEGSLAAASGFQAGDVIETLDGQPLLSIADVQWVLHNVPAEGGSVVAHVLRKGAMLELTLHLPRGWRSLGDLSWRSTSWGLRRMTTGGMRLEQASAAERHGLGLSPEDMALRVQHVGQYGAHATAKKKGFQPGDIIVQFAGRRDLLRETDVLHYSATKLMPGAEVAVTVFRNGQELQLKLPMQP